ncbi:hypothetical protein [Clostridium perfringens]|uniref:hypothetical protein n=1 Tax=Clostridium perfringens TaxID=1502 RepID=UPI0023408CFD|nr:hypothetical protein [Clostridium perfringens]MDC4245566.1 hypothetical protein [Clostridium perfringens]
MWKKSIKQGEKIMTQGKILIGQKIGLLTVLEKKSEKKARGSKIYYLCQCECGNKKWIRADNLKKSKSCGCRGDRDLIGKKFGRLTVINKVEGKSKRRKKEYLCECECGNEKIVCRDDLISSHTRSCGCLHKEKSSINGKKAFNFLKENDLIEGTSIIQLQREKPIKTNTSGTTGVTFESRKGKWRAYLEFKGKRYNLGSFTDKNEAINARKEAEEKIVKPFLEGLKENKEGDE